MARKLRVVRPGAIYHVMNRGDRREPIFRFDRDRVLVPDPLTGACRKTGWQMQARCLMLNQSGGPRVGSGRTGAASERRSANSENCPAAAGGADDDAAKDRATPQPGHGGSLVNRLRNTGRKR